MWDFLECKFKNTDKEEMIFLFSNPIEGYTPDAYVTPVAMKAPEGLSLISWTQN